MKRLKQLPKDGIKQIPKLTYNEMKDRFEKNKTLADIMPTPPDGNLFFDFDKQIENIEVDYDESKKQTPMIMMLETGPEIESDEVSLQLTSYNAFKENGEWVFEKRHK